VSYSAGLLDYYFRGTFGVSVNWDTNSGQTSSPSHTSSQDFSGGSFFLLEESNGTGYRSTK